jgi:hypothetical protein
MSPNSAFEPDAEPLLFNQLFVDYVQSIFFKNPDKSFSVFDMRENMPSFYHHLHMVSSAINILIMQEKVDQLPLVGDLDMYRANPKAIKQLHEEIDLNNKIKLYTKKNLVSQYWPLKYWWLISGGTILLSALASYLVGNLTTKTPTQPIIRTEQMQPPSQRQLPPEKEIDSGQVGR